MTSWAPPGEQPWSSSIRSAAVRREKPGPPRRRAPVDLGASGVLGGASLCAPPTLGWCLISIERGHQLQLPMERLAASLYGAGCARRYITNKWPASATSATKYRY